MSHNNKAAALKHKIQPRGNRIQSGLNKKCIMFFMCVIYIENTNKQRMVGSGLKHHEAHKVWKHLKKKIRIDCFSIGV